MHDRLVQLERLVMSVMSSSAAASNMHTNTHTNADVGVRQLMPTPADTMPSETPIDGLSECGSMRISASELRYLGGDHWVAILEGIADLKDHVDREEQLRLAETPDQTADDPANDSGDSTAPRQDRAFLLYGCCRPTSRDEILSALPPRYAVDRYISRYFNYLDLVSSGKSFPCCLWQITHLIHFSRCSWPSFFARGKYPSFILRAERPPLTDHSMRPSGLIPRLSQ